MYLCSIYLILNIKLNIIIIKLIFEYFPIHFRFIVNSLGPYLPSDSCLARFRIWSKAKRQFFGLVSMYPNSYSRPNLGLNPYKLGLACTHNLIWIHHFYNSSQVLKRLHDIYHIHFVHNKHKTNISHLNKLIY